MAILSIFTLIPTFDIVSLFIVIILEYSNNSDNDSLNLAFPKGLIFLDKQNCLYRA